MESQRVLTGAEIIWECLIREGVKVVFGYPGGTILPTYDALTKYRDKVHHVLARHEQGAAHMADGYARVSGKVGVAIATSGPGATNLVTGLATAQMDSVPIVCITGQVPVPVIGTDAFQETDVTGVSLAITKHSYLVTDIHDLAHSIREAFYVARMGRPGPVLIDIPKDIQNETIEFEYPTYPIELPGFHPPTTAPDHQVKSAVELINSAQKPVILAGHGVLISGAIEELKVLVEKGKIPVSTTLLGIGSIPGGHPLNLGMMGMHGTAQANRAIQNADLLIACGMRYDDRVTGKLKTYSPNSKKIHIDIDESELNKSIRVDVAIHGDLSNVLQQINPGVISKDRGEWIAQTDEWKNDSNRRDILNKQTEVLMGAQVVHGIWKGTNGNARVVTDVGQNQMLTAQYYKHKNSNALITSGGLGTMGFGLPAAIGVSFAMKDQEVWAIVGDGGIQMTIQELGTAVQENRNINIAILNNGYLGMVRQWQQLFYDSRYAETPISSPDYVKLAEAYGMPGYRVDKLSDVIPTVQKARDYHGPTLIEFIIERHDMVYPMVPAGADLHEMLLRPESEQKSVDK